MNMFARFDENPAMTLQDIKETKLTSYSPKVKKYKSILLKLVLLLYYLCLPVKIYYIHMYTTVTDLVNIYI